jgi:hypothetical protein
LEASNRRYVVIGHGLAGALHRIDDLSVSDRQK